MSGFFIFTLIVSVKYLEIMIFDCLSSNLYLWSLHLWSLHLWLFICDLFICDLLHLWSLHLWLFICDLFICDLFICDSSSVTLHLWSLHLWALYLWALHLWLFICDLFICDSSSVISSSVTLHLWSQYIWYMAWLEVWPFSCSVLISGELLYHIEKTVRLVLWVLNTTINNISYVISWQVSLNDGKNTMVRHHPLPIVKWVVFLFSL